MKKMCKGVAVCSMMVGLICMASCVSVGELVGSMFGGGSFVIGLSTKDSSKEYAGLTLQANGSVEAVRYSNSTKVKGTWENSSGSTKSVENGDTITVTVEEKTVKGTVRKSNRTYVPYNPNNSEDPGDYYITKYSVTLGAWGLYTYDHKEYESVK